MSSETTRVSGQAVTELPLAADKALAALESLQAVMPVPGWTRTNNTFEFDIADTEGRSNGTGIITLIDGTGDACTMKLSIHQNSSDFPDQPLDEVGQGLGRAANLLVQQMASMIKETVQAGTASGQELELICVREVRFAADAGAVMHAIDEKFSNVPSYARSGGVASIDLPFEWTFDRGGLEIIGSSPGTLTLTVDPDKLGANLNVKYSVDFSQAPEDGRLLIKNRLSAIVNESEPVWREALTPLIAAGL